MKEKYWTHRNRGEKSKKEKIEQNSEKTTVESRKWVKNEKIPEIKKNIKKWRKKFRKMEKNEGKH